MRLNPVERIRLLELLPPEGNIFNMKLVRKLRESLSFNEKELSMVILRYEYHCSFEEKDERGAVTRCDAAGFYSTTVKCAKHGCDMTPTGRMNFNFTPELGNAQKDIHMGDEAIKLIRSAFVPHIAALDNAGKVTEEMLVLYEKFFPSEETPK